MAKRKCEKWLTKEGLALIAGWARDGLIEEDIAHNIGVTRKTLFNWKNEFKEIAEALKEGKEVADYIVESALFKSATGYTYTEEQLSASGKKETVKKYQQPNTTAMIFWLKNRRPEKWRDKVDVNSNVNGNVEVVIVDDI